MGKALIIHHQVGKTDGVSLEIEKRKKILEKQGHTVKLVSGPIQDNADYIIEDLSINRGFAKKINFNGINNITDYFDSFAYKCDFYKLVEKIRKPLVHIIKEEKPDHIFIHNILSLGRSPAAAVAFLQVMDIFRIPTTSTNHDIYWERDELIENPVDLITELYEDYLLLDRNYIKHVVINSQSQKELKEKRNIEAEIIPDVFDFNQVLWEEDTQSRKLKKLLKIDKDTLVVLHATRIVPRKAIEIAIEYVSKLQKKLDKKIVFFLSNYVETMEKDAREYAQKLVNKASKLNVDLRFSNGYFLKGATHTSESFSFWDGYKMADLITYTSTKEGYGNQFIEAMFAKKPTVVFEYPVFLSDIKPKGYKYISLGKRIKKIDKDNFVCLEESVIEKAVDKTISILSNPKLKEEITEKNFKIAKKYNSMEILEKHLKEEMQRK